MRIYKLEEADKKKARFINSHPDLSDDEKEYLLNLYLKPEVPDNIINWQKIKDLSFDTLKDIAEGYLKGREEKKNKKNLSKALEGRDFIKIFGNKNSEGTEYLYLPLTWLGSKYLASDHFLPKIKVPSKVMNARDFSDNSAKNEELSPGAKWCISLWTLPDLVINDKPVTDENGKELRHEGKRYWLDYTSGGAYFLFYFRDYPNLNDINKKIAFTLKQGSSFIRDITLADDTRGGITSPIERIQEYWDEHYKEYESQIKHIREVSTKDKPEFDEYEKQKEEEASKYVKYSIIKDFFTYNDDTGRYDSDSSLDIKTLKYIVEDGKFIIPLGIIKGHFNCNALGLRTLENGPTEVTDYFSCSSNNLTTLEYAPKKVGQGFYCDSNPSLTTLKGAPEYVGRDFDCSTSQLTSLEGAPKEIEGNFYCYNNKLTNLKGAPEYVKLNFHCFGNDLTTLEGAPRLVGMDFNCSYNKLTSLEYAPQRVGNFKCFHNPLQSRELSTKVTGRITY